MAFFFKLNEKIYKTTDNLIIGRGSPFEDLNKFRDILRSHCKIKKINNNFFIKRLNEKSKVLVNEAEIPVDEYIKVSKEDNIYLANLKLEFLETCESENYKVVNRFYSPFALASKLSFSKSGIIISISIFLFIQFMQLITDSKIQLSIIEDVFLSIFIGFFITLQSKIMSKLGSSYSELLVNEIIIGKSGLTIHYKNENISILYSNIEQFYKKQKFIFIHAYNQKFVISHLKNQDKLYSTIERFLTEKVINKPKPNNFLPNRSIIVSFALSILVIFYFLSLSSSWAKMELVNLLIFVLIVLILLIKKDGILLGNSKTQKATLKHKRFSIIFLCIMIYINITNYIELTNSQKYYNHCISGNSTSCNKISFETLISEFLNKQDEFKTTINKICKVEPNFCKTHSNEIRYYLNSRSISSNHDLQK